ncbi:P-loop NTPase fold protein [Eggerthella timonensis]|uniref:P-loop NTPase fold protein n=1 Tax=Eggerthella timonensis TaxID=1871008 RepID=UPI000C780AFA|nr:P-loop NTPase fold protein [Eggerthella timonensis]
MSTEWEILEVVREYILNGHSRHAVLIDGEWGTGKTRFVKEVLKPNLEGIENPYIVIRVSLFGVASSDELFNRVVESAVNEYASIESDPTGKRSEDLAKFAKEAGISSVKKQLKKVVGKTGVSYSASPKLMASLMCGKRCLIVFDDVERRGKICDDELFGAINDLVEGQQRKVLLVANNKEPAKAIPKEIMEKLIWPVCQFTPDVERLAHSLLGNALSRYPSDLNANQELVRTLQERGFRNARALLKATDLVALIADTSFVKDESHDMARKQSTLRDVWGFVCSVAQGVYPSMPSEGHDERESFADILNRQVEKENFEKFSLLPFVRQYFDKAESPDLDVMSEQLVDYANKYHPQTLREQRALEAQDVVFGSRIDDDDAEKAKGSILEALEFRQLGVSNIPKSLCALSLLESWGFVDEDTWNDAIRFADEILSSNIMESYRLISSDDFSWSCAFFEGGGKGVEAVRALKKDTFDRYDACASDEMKKSIDVSSPDSGSDLAEFMEERLRSDHFDFRLFPEDLFVACVKSSSVGSLVALRVFLQGLEERMLSIRRFEGTEEWLQKSVELIRNITPASKMKKVHIDWMITSMEGMLERLNCKSN